MRLVATDWYVHGTIPEQARTCKKFIKIILPLVSVGRLFVNGLIVAFDATHVYVLNKEGQILSTGTRDPEQNLYLLPIACNTGTHVPQRVGVANLIEEQQVLHRALIA